MEAELFKSSIAKDIFSPVAKMIVGLISLIQLHYLFVEKFKITNLLILDLSSIALSPLFIIVTLVLTFWAGYVVVILGTASLNFSARIIRNVLKEELSNKLLPIDPFLKAYSQQNDYSKYIFETICSYLGLKSNLRGIEFYRLCRIIASQNEALYRSHIYSFDICMLRGFLINSLLFVIIAVLSQNIIYIIFSLILFCVIYNENRMQQIHLRETIYDQAFFKASQSGK